MTTIFAVLRRSPVLPVIVIDSADSAADLGRALLGGGIGAAEITLRSPEALDALTAMKRACPELMVGAGTVLTPAQARDAEQAGADFLVSPGLTRRLAEAFMDARIPALPGVGTASEAMGAREAGFKALKFFPAEANGGVAALKALAGPLPHLSFCPTGGITQEIAPQYLALSSVMCVGGSWITPAKALAERDWGEVELRARQVAALSPRA
ncbi:MAG: bifunctional 4-hydroxy-2-oxoglutarate aldolase/2-dehydro-3-deoxy-phosphogluconate aldolase [Maricaulaceae bacterium]